MYKQNKHNIRKIKNSKKAFIASGMMDMWLFVMFVLVAIIFVVLVMITDHNIEEKIAAESGKIAVEQYFMHYLKMPVKMDTKGWTMTPLEMAGHVSDTKSSNIYYTKMVDSSQKYWDGVNMAAFYSNLCSMKIFVGETVQGRQDWILIAQTYNTRIADSTTPSNNMQTPNQNKNSPKYTCANKKAYEEFYTMQVPEPIGITKTQNVILLAEFAKQT